MKLYGMFAAAALVLTIASPAMAGNLVAKPIQQPGQTIRFDRGHPTIEDDMPTAGVRVLPIEGLDHGSFQFEVAVFNKLASPVNVGVENVVAHHGAMTLTSMTKDELAHQAKKRAFWSQLGYAMLAGVAAGVQNNNTVITTSTPHGFYRTTIHQPGLSDGQIATVAAGGGAIALSQIGLQKTLERLDGEIMQTSTIDPQTGYGGRVVVRKLTNPKPGDNLLLDVDVGGEHHLFTFALAKS